MVLVEILEDMRRCGLWMQCISSSWVGWRMSWWKEAMQGDRRCTFSTSSFDPHLILDHPDDANMMIIAMVVNDDDDAHVMVDDPDVDELALLVIRWPATGTCELIICLDCNHLTDLVLRSSHSVI